VGVAKRKAVCTPPLYLLRWKYSEIKGMKREGEYYKRKYGTGVAWLY